MLFAVELFRDTEGYPDLLGRFVHRPHPWFDPFHLELYFAPVLDAALAAGVSVSVTGLML